MALPQSKYIIQALFNGNEQNIARDGVFDTSKAQALDYNKLAAEVRDIADDLLKAALVTADLNMEAVITDLDSRITAIVAGVGDVEVLRVPTDHSDVSDALAAAEAGTTKYTIILIEAVAPAGAQAVTITKPTKFIGTSDVAEIDFGATKVIVDFPATSEQSILEFQDLKISRSDTAEAFDIVGDAVIRLNNCVITDDVVAAPTFAIFETAASKTLEVFLNSTLLQTTTANGLLFKSGGLMTLHLDDTNANNTVNSGTIFDAGAGLILNMSNHSFIDQATVTTTTFTLTYDGTSIYIDNGSLTASGTKIIHGVAYYDLSMTFLNVKDAIQNHVVPTTSRRKLLIGPGDYTMTTAAVISSPSLEIEGSGISTSIKVTAGTEAITVSASEVTIKNLQIQLDGTSLRGITITTGSNQNIFNIFFDNISGINFDLIRVTGGSDIIVDRCVSQVTAGTIQKAFFGSGGTGPITVTNFIANDINNIGFRTDVARTIFDSCQLKANGTATLMNIFASDCLVSDCTMIGDGIAAITGLSTSAARIRIDNCDFVDVGTGISIGVASTDLAIDGGTIRLFSTGTVFGITSTPGSNTFTVSNVIIDGNGNAVAASIGIRVSGLTNKASLLGIKIRNLTAGDGILFTHTILTTSDSIISDCRIESLGGKGINIKNMERVTVTGNHIRASGSDNIKLDGAKECNVSVNHCSGSVAGFGINEAGAANFNLIGTNHCRGNSSGAVNVIGANSVESDTMS